MDAVPNSSYFIMMTESREFYPDWKMQFVGDGAWFDNANKGVMTTHNGVSNYIPKP